jgi:hypothetical protein
MSYEKVDYRAADLSQKKKAENENEQGQIAVDDGRHQIRLRWDPQGVGRRWNADAQYVDDGERERRENRDGSRGDRGSDGA